MMRKEPFKILMSGVGDKKPILACQIGRQPDEATRQAYAERGIEFALCRQDHFMAARVRRIIAARDAFSAIYDGDVAFVWQTGTA